MNKEQLDKLYNIIWFEVLALKDKTLKIISNLAKSQDEKDVAFAKKIIIDRVKKIVPKHLKDLNAKDLKQLTKYITQKYQSLETLSSYHKRQETNSYVIDMFEMAICKCVSAYQKQKEKLNQNYAGKSVKNEQKM